MVLARLMAFKSVPLGMATEALFMQIRGQAPGALGKLAEGKATITKDKCFAIWDCSGNNLADKCQVELFALGNG